MIQIVVGKFGGSLMNRVIVAIFACITLGAVANAQVSMDDLQNRYDTRVGSIVLDTSTSPATPYVYVSEWAAEVRNIPAAQRDQAVPLIASKFSFSEDEIGAHLLLLPLEIYDARGGRSQLQPVARNRKYVYNFDEYQKLPHQDFEVESIPARYLERKEGFARHVPIEIQDTDEYKAAMKEKRSRDAFGMAAFMMLMMSTPTNETSSECELMYIPYSDGSGRMAGVCAQN